MSPSDFLIEDYKLKVSYLISQFSRMWTRFNFFLTIEMATFGFLAFLLFDSKDRNVEASLIPIVLGCLVSVLWYGVGAQDRALVEGYRDEMKCAAKRIAGKWDELGWYATAYVGSTYVEDERTFIRHSWCSWYWKRASITTLAAIIPVGVFLIWVAVGLAYPFWKSCFAG